VDHQYNHNQAGLGTTCCLATTAKGYPQTNFTCSKASPAPEERLKRAAQSHALPEQCCLSPSLPCLLQSHFPNQSSAQHSSTLPEVSPVTSLPIERAAPHHKKKQATLPTPHPKNSKTEAKGVPSCGLKWVGLAGFCKFPLQLEPASSLHCERPSRKKPTLRRQRGAICREQRASSSLATGTQPPLSQSRGCWHQITGTQLFTPPSHPTGQHKENLLGCCSRSRGRACSSPATHQQSPLTPPGTTSEADGSTQGLPKGTAAPARHQAAGGWEQGFVIPRFSQHGSQPSGSGFLFISSLCLAEGNSFPKDVIKLHGHRMRQETGMQTGPRKAGEVHSRSRYPLYVTTYTEYQ